VILTQAPAHQRADQSAGDPFPVRPWRPLPVGPCLALGVSSAFGLSRLTAPGAFRQVLLYLGSGVLSAGVDLGLLVVLHEQTRLPLALCTALAFVAALAVNFSLNRRAWVGAGIENLLRHARRYGVLVAANLVFTVLLVSGGAQLGIPYLLAKIVALALSTAWTFALYRAWVFV